VFSQVDNLVCTGLSPQRRPPHGVEVGPVS
jgi:hypothetical protein